MSAETSAGEALLLGYHARFPGATALTAADARDPSGRSSYQRLVDDVSALGPGRVLDLACGDGYLLERLVSPGRELTGVDMSPHELAAARKRLNDAATLVEGRAKALPFADASFDCVVSHLALMLMERLDEVAAEVARVLRPGGWCYAVVGVNRDSPESTMFRCFREAWLAIVDPASHSLPPIGDVRGRTDDGILALFSASGFTNCTSERFTLSRPGTAREVAERYGSFYPPGFLPDADHERFVSTLTEALIERERAGETIEFLTTNAHIRARRAG